MFEHHRVVFATVFKGRFHVKLSQRVISFFEKHPGVRIKISFVIGKLRNYFGTHSFGFVEIAVY